jgi:aspartokinase
VIDDIESHRCSWQRGEKFVISSVSNQSFVQIIEGEGDGEERRSREARLFHALASCDLGLDMVAVNYAGVFFAINSAHADRVRLELINLNVAFSIRSRCTMIVARVGYAPCLISTDAALEALSSAGVTVVHYESSGSRIAVLLDDADVLTALSSLEHAFDKRNLMKTGSFVQPSLLANGRRTRILHSKAVEREWGKRRVGTMAS